MAIKARIVTVVLLVEDGTNEQMDDSINNALRPATEDMGSFIIDYAFNSDGNFPDLPAPQPYQIEEGYTQDDFITALNKPRKASS